MPNTRNYTTYRAVYVLELLMLVAAHAFARDAGHPWLAYLAISPIAAIAGFGIVFPERLASMRALETALHAVAAALGLVLLVSLGRVIIRPERPAALSHEIFHRPGSPAP